ncbi:hypothetical protein CONLIGDRAFT_637566 [Coniochaeta ligniaria NRRL 30616]|uniref:DUF6536 domain-containing protein n=1 Tax=Coniochaeta ligniaria NRRL 30616 TaxID=1408157 RepID=A0A1J7I7H2_9PEZI|nr:hypothetical protein CONLIGDRAFT_637566 [Coniochaeta ligniaria NRRL 30616]
MEIVIPPRDHGASTYRYTWDENGEVTQVTRVNEPQQPGHTHRARGRQTVQWPFQSIATVETSLLSQIADQPFPFRPFSNPRDRRATWEPKRLLPRSRGSDSETTARDLIPDYVINYIRGETPETVARRKRNGGKLGERLVDVVTPTGHRPHQSRTAEFEGFLDDDSGDHGGDRPRSPGDGDEEHMLGGRGEKRLGRGSGWRKFMHGWRGGVMLNLLLGSLILVAGSVCLIYAAAKVSLSAGESVIFSASCVTAERIGMGLHALINALVVVLLAGGNYIFQVLSSPTRREVDVAHAKKKWLDIGIPSLRNLAHISRSRAVLAVVVLLVATATQVIYNAVIFTSQTAVDYNILSVTQSFRKGAPFSNATSNNEGKLSRLDILSLQDLASRNALVNLTAAECSTRFSAAYQADFSAVLLVTNIDSTTSSLVQTASGSSSSTSRLSLINSGSTALPNDQQTVEFCLAQRSDAEQTCQVNLNGSLLGVVVFLNLITVIITTTILFRRSLKSLVSLGDALSSFLQHPDPTTSGSCLMTKPDVREERWGLREAKFWMPRNHFWFRTPSLPRWSIITFFWLALTSLTATALALTVRADPTGALSSFGIASPHALYLLPSSLPISGATLISALPQLLLAALYLATNSHMTIYHLSHESSLFALGNPRPLRVTCNPQGSQTTSLFLTLPRPWSWLLVTLFAAKSFVLSQSVFLVSVHLTPAPPLTALGFSSTGLLALLALLFLLALTILTLALRRAPPAVSSNSQAVGNPLALEAGSCSAVLSARCHAAPQERNLELWKRPLTWGVVDGGGPVNVAHCSFTAGRAGDVDLGRSYA